MRCCQPFVHRVVSTNMEITSTFENDQEIPVRYTCMGLNISPPFTFHYVPSAAKSLVLIVEDVDATPAPWRHWHVFNIPPATTSVAEGTVPAGGTEGLCNNHTFGYEGPCPKYFSGTHHYWFRLYALDTMLDLPPESEPDEVLNAMQGHLLETATLIGTCKQS
ncbi:hypothetical protein SAMN05421747_12357 [Parapedobacter composti]|uniref:Phospholipid-binding protein, PBP family n=2 Tax=Parapedobacter composti TaxID=623281 RepID=A0A1I1LS59_9SPHI|nr:hypothetical protein SAMN05421747_12357 [Parapedobacter composti]